MTSNSRIHFHTNPKPSELRFFDPPRIVPLFMEYNVQNAQYRTWLVDVKEKKATEVLFKAPLALTSKIIDAIRTISKDPIQEILRVELMVAAIKTDTGLFGSIGQYVEFHVEVHRVIRWVPYVPAHERVKRRDGEAEFADLIALLDRKDRWPCNRCHKLPCMCAELDIIDT